jgi:hypothetical protein
MNVQVFTESPCRGAVARFPARLLKITLDAFAETCENLPGF